MSTDPFAAPAPPGEGIKWADFQSCLLAIQPKSEETGIQTAYGTTDAVRADVAVLDGPHKGAVIHDTLVFPKLLQGQLKSRVGQIVLGRLGQGAAKPGQSAPWLLSEATDEDKQVGMAWLASRQQDPAQPAQPAPAQQGQPAAAAQNVPF